MTNYQTSSLATPDLAERDNYQTIENLDIDNSLSRSAGSLEGRKIVNW